MKVHTRKLNNPAKNPINVPAFVPSKIAVITTGTMAIVATIPNIGIEPKMVKHTKASIASRIANWAIQIIKS